MPKSKKQKLSSTEESKIWFHLYDSANGLPYMGTTADYVSIPSSADIAQFRKAVKAEYSDSHLKGIGPSDLLVFQNKQSFDKRDAAVENGVPLDEESSVDGLGKSKDDALIVAVHSSDKKELEISHVKPTYPLIWFHLYEYETGLPYKETTATSVSLPPQAVIDNFRKAVKAEYSDSHLKGIGPSDLLVFQNKQSFDRRDSTVEKGVPLDEESSVDGLGKSKDDALIVIVKGRESSSDFSEIFKSKRNGEKSHINAEKMKLCYNGPLDENVHFMIPIEILGWGKELIGAVEGGEVVLLHGPWQSGKTSALRYLRTVAELAGRKVYYIDMLECTSAIRNCQIHGFSMFQFLAWNISENNSPIEETRKFMCASDFCKWMEFYRGKDTLPPLLLIDEYDSFLQVSRDDYTMLEQMNHLINFSRNNQSTFQSIVCAGTFSIIATQFESSENMNEIDIESHTLQKKSSDESFDAIVRPFDVVSPWNKSRFIETAPFNRDLFNYFFLSLFDSYGVVVEGGVADDIWGTTAGHPGFSMWLCAKSLLLAMDKSCKLSTFEWMQMKRNVFSDKLLETPTITKILTRVKSSKRIFPLLDRLVRFNEIFCDDTRMFAFLRSVGVARPTNKKDCITVSSPIIRDALLRHFYPPYDDIVQILEIPGDFPRNYTISIMLKAIPFIKAPQLLDKLVIYEKGLSEAAIHAELYRILHSLLRTDQIQVLTETKVVESSAMRCDIWMTTKTLTEFGIEFKTELNNKQMQNAASGQLLKYASSRNPREMILVNFVRKEVDSVRFPIDIIPTDWEKYSDTQFNVLFVLVLGDLEQGLKFRFATNGDSGWIDLVN